MTEPDSTLYIRSEDIRKAIRARSNTLSTQTNASSQVPEAVTQPVLILIIGGMVERFVMDELFSLILGRNDIHSEKQPDFDLTPYGAVERGVSRLHLRLHLQDAALFITDLDSTNGTYMGEQRLTPNEPVRFEKGSKLMLARMPIRVLYR